MPPASSPTPSSPSEHSIPSDTVPRIVATSTRRPPGRRAPGGAKAARTPSRTFGAPQTTRYRSAPVDTSQIRSVPLAGWGATVSTSATTSPASSEAPSATGAVSMPAIVSRSATSRGPAAVSTNSRSQR